MGVPSQRWLFLAGGPAAVSLLVGGLVARFVHVREARIADAREWRVEGAPCPQISAATLLATPGKGLHSFTYGDVDFARRFGEVECAPIYEDGGRGDRFHAVCRFDRPGDLRVRTTRGEWRFRPGPGRAATVSTEEGRARCVMPMRSAERGRA